MQSRFKINIHKLEFSKFLQQSYKMSGKVISTLPIRNHRLSGAKQDEAAGKKEDLTSLSSDPKFP